MHPVVTQPLPFTGSAQHPQERFGVQHKCGHMNKAIPPPGFPLLHAPSRVEAACYGCAKSILFLLPALAPYTGITIPPPFFFRHLACTEQEKYGKLEFPSLGEVCTVVWAKPKVSHL